MYLKHVKDVPFDTILARRKVVKTHPLKSVEKTVLEEVTYAKDNSKNWNSVHYFASLALVA